MDASSFLHPAAAVHAAHIHESLMVADFGAGSGFFTRAAAREVAPHGTVWAVDAHQEMLSRLKNLAIAEGLQNVEVMHGNVEKQGGSHLPPQSFDSVIIANILFGTEDKVAVVREAKRVLKRNGRALVIDWTGSFGGLGPHADHVVTMAAAKKLFDDEGFTMVEPPAGGFPAGAYHWGFVAKK